MGGFRGARKPDLNVQIFGGVRTENKMQLGAEWLPFFGNDVLSAVFESLR